MQYLKHMWIGMAVLWSTSAALGQGYSPKKLSAEEAQACLADNGRVTAVGLGGDEGCIRPMPDGGKACTDGSQCKSYYCIADPKKGRIPPSRIGSKGVGICTPTNAFPSCMDVVRNGRFQIGSCQ